MRILFLLFLCALISNCVSTPPVNVVNELMMANGDWKFISQSNQDCRSYLQSQNNLDEAARPDIDLANLKNVFKKTEERPEVKIKSDDIKLCIEKYKDTLKSRAAELCSDGKYELYGCVNSEDKTIQSDLQYATYGYYMTCYMRCKK